MKLYFELETDDGNQTNMIITYPDADALNHIIKLCNRMKKVAELYDVALLSYGEAKINAVKTTRNFTHLGLKDAKELVEQAPVVILSCVTIDRAKEVVDEFDRVGCSAEMRLHPVGQEELTLRRYEI